MNNTYLKSKEEKFKKKQAIMHAAISVFGEIGYGNTRMIDIAAHAGVGKSTIYDYFKNKQDIFVYAFDFFFNGIDQICMSILSLDISAEEKILQIIELFLNESAGQNQDFIKIMMDFWAEGIRNKDKEGNILLTRVYAQFRSLIERVLIKGIKNGEFRRMDAKITSSILLGAMDGIFLQWLMDNDLFTFKEVSDTLKELFFKGVLK